MQIHVQKPRGGENENKVTLPKNKKITSNWGDKIQGQAVLLTVVSMKHPTTNLFSVALRKSQGGWFPTLGAHLAHKRRVMDMLPFPDHWRWGHKPGSPTPQRSIPHPGKLLHLFECWILGVAYDPPSDLALLDFHNSLSNLFHINFRKARIMSNQDHKSCY